MWMGIQFGLCWGRRMMPALTFDSPGFSSLQYPQLLWMIGA